MTLSLATLWKIKMVKIYLDHAATTQTHPKVAKAMLPNFTDSFGNPSSLYSCRQEVRNNAYLIGSRYEEIIFTSGRTEADNFAMKGTAFANESGGADKGRQRWETRGSNITRKYAII